jgi:Nucleotidyltransferase of unknown function (DUF6036)
VTYRRYTTEELQTLFRAIDDRLDAPAELILIGGAAALLAYHATTTTHDIDVLNDIDAVKVAYNEAKEQTGLEIPLSKAGVAEAPYNYDERLIKYQEISLRNLVIWIPDVHDLILMKTVRAAQHDLEVIEEIAKKNPVDAMTLMKRFETEMGHVMVNETRLRINFSAVLARCFGDEVAEKWMNGQSADDIA